MKQLVFDKLERQVWYWISLGLAGLVLGLDIPDFQYYNILGQFIIGSVWYYELLTDLGSGYGRIVLTLPFTKRQIGQALWLTSVGLPALAFAIGSGIGNLIYAMEIGSFGASLVGWLQLVVFNGLFFGSLFWLFGSGFGNGSSPQATGSKTKRTACRCYRALFWLALAGLGYELFQAPFSREAKFFIVCLLMLPLAFFGWYRAENLLEDYNEHHQTATAGASCSGKYQPPTGFGGLRLLLSYYITRQLVPMLYLIFLGFLICNWTNHGPATIGDWATIMFLYGITEWQTTGDLFAHQKYLQTLPLSSKQLASVFLLLTVVPFVITAIFMGTLLTASRGLAASLPVFYATAFLLTPLCGLTTARVYHAKSEGVIVAAVFFPSVISFFFMAVWGTNLPLALVILYGLACLIGSFFAIAYFIETNDLAYRRRDTPDAWAANQ